MDSDEIDRTTENEAADTKFGSKGNSVLEMKGNEMSLDEFENGFKDSGEKKNPVTKEGRFQKQQIDDDKNEHQIRNEKMERPNLDSEEKTDSEEVEKGDMISEEMLERSKEGGTDYKEEPEEEESEFQIEKTVMSRPVRIEVPRVISQ